jgi:hypothetical protein
VKRELHRRRESHGEERREKKRAMDEERTVKN